MIELYYTNELVTLYHGDCLEVMQQLNLSVSCCITDPPYGTTACKWDSVIPFDKMWRRLDNLVKENGAVCLFGSEPFSSALRMSNIKNFKYDWIWEKNKCTGFVNAKLKPMNRHENISVFSHGKTSNGNAHNMAYHPQGLKRVSLSRTNGARPDHENTYMRPSIARGTEYNQEYTGYPDTILRFSVPRNFVHPTQKPVALIEYLIKTYTNENELVLDFTCGSGTTGVACMRTNRRCVLIEQDEKYCEVAKQRMIEEESKTELFNWRNK